ncbi:MAG: HAMP domain-containing protein [Chloroflexi bacterium]|nr:HAMP domain-containing protein [Chloroflexota bacterium]
MNIFFPFKSLRSGLLTTYLVLIAVSLGLLAWRVGASLDASRFSETKRDQEGRAILAAGVAGDWMVNYRDQKMDHTQLWDETLTLAREINQSIALFDSQGRLLLDTEHPTEPIGLDESTLPEVNAALQGQSTTIVRYDDDDHGDAMFSVSPIRFGRDFIGVLRLELRMSLVEQTSFQFWVRIIGATLLAALVTIIVSLLFARALTDPLARISRAANAMANGDLKQRLQVNGPIEYQRLSNSFNFMAERISRVMDDQRAFVANAAHELRTPLTTIRLRAEALSEGAKDEPEVATQFLSDISNETERLSRLVDQLLSLSRLESGLVEPRRVPLALNTLAKQVIHDYAMRAQEARLVLRLNAPESLPVVNADADQMRQVMINLISNSIKFTRAGGTITVEMAARKQAHSSENLPAGNWVVTTVCDSGEGIPAEDLPHIFERFYRSDKARARDTGGAGLGLAIVKSIIDTHAGYVWATSERGKGSRIAFALPQTQPKDLS